MSIATVEVGESILKKDTFIAFDDNDSFEVIL